MRLKHLVFILLSALVMAACGSDDEVVGSGNSVDQDNDNTTATINDNYTYKLPVIFHVLYTNENDSVRALSSHLTQVLKYVNEIYQGNVYGWRGVYSEDINVDFQPATTDEKGSRLSTPGVTFEKWNGSFPIDASQFMSSKNTQYMWDPNEYINVMVYPFKQDDSGSIILGISHMPYTLNDSTFLDGLETSSVKYISKSNLGFPYCVSINSDYLYYMSTRYILPKHGQEGYRYNACDIVATLAHELGHYLGLHHAFTEEKKEEDGQTSWSEVDDCFDSDFCDDTPSYNKVEYDKFLANLSKTAKSDEITMDTLVARQSCDGTKFNSQNIMDYSVGFAFQITADQKQRIRHVLYYSPLIPGPKKNKANTRAAVSEEGIIKLPIVTSE